MQVISFGRSTKNNVVISDPKVSNVHLQIVQHDDGHFSLVDLHSTNGTYVNGQRIQGEVLLRPNDTVLIGNTRLHWQQYFGMSASNGSNNNLGIILGSVGGGLVLIILLIVLLIGHRKRIQDEPRILPDYPQYTYRMDNVKFDLGMPLRRVEAVNNDASMEKYTVPEKDDVVYSASYDYYIVNQVIALIPDDDDEIEGFCTKSSDYKTPKGVGVGNTWGDIEREYTNLEFWLDFHYYDYFAHCWETTIEIIDPATCTQFIFFRRQFTSAQWEAIMSICAETDCWSTFSISELSVSMRSSIRETLTIAQVIVEDCSEESMPDEPYKQNESQPATPNSSSQTAQSSSNWQGEAIPANLVGTKWQAEKSMRGMPMTIEFIDSHHLIYGKEMMYDGWQEATLECLYNSQEDIIQALANPGLYSYKYENGRLYVLFYAISDKGYRKSFKLKRIK
jgi:hypothetical protein